MTTYEVTFKERNESTPEALKISASWIDTGDSGFLIFKKRVSKDKSIDVGVISREEILHIAKVEE